MQALGLIETKGLVAAIEGADAMLKAAHVRLLEKNDVGGGLVTITITGDVGAVKAAVEAGVGAVNHMNEKALISHHVIPRPHGELKGILLPAAYREQEIAAIEVTAVVDEEVPTTVKEENKANVQEIEIVTPQDAVQGSASQPTMTPPKSKAGVGQLLEKVGLEETMKILDKITVVKLRNLAREYQDFPINGRKISKAGKQLLMTAFRETLEKTPIH